MKNLLKDHENRSKLLFLKLKFTRIFLRPQKFYFIYLRFYYQTPKILFRSLKTCCETPRISYHSSTAANRL